MTTLAAISDQSSIDPGAVAPILIAAAAALVVTVAVIAWRDAGRRLDDAIEDVLGPDERPAWQDEEVQA